MTFRLPMLQLGGAGPRVYPQPSTLNPQPSTLNPQPSTLTPQPSTPVQDDRSDFTQNPDTLYTLRQEARNATVVSPLSNPPGLFASTLWYQDETELAAAVLVDIQNSTSVHPQLLNPKPSTPPPKPQALNPKPSTLNPKPQTLSPEP